jgi:hypothetical protein
MVTALIAARLNPREVLFLDAKTPETVHFLSRWKF